MLDERTKVVARKVTRFLTETGDPFQKTIVFYVDREHAARMRQALINENADLVDGNHRYVMRITGGDPEGQAELGNFIDPESRYPVLVTTSRLLSTGVDVQTCRLIVLDREVGSMTEFKQEEEVTVKRWGIIRVSGKVYSLPSRLIGHRVRVRVHANHLEVRYRGALVARPDRVRGEGLEGIDYRRMVHSLIRKPGAFRRYVYREAMFPSLVFRRAYDALCERSERWADLEYIRILHLAATTMQCEVESALGAVLKAGEVPEYDDVKARIGAWQPPACPQVRVGPPLGYWTLG